MDNENFLYFVLSVDIDEDQYDTLDHNSQQQLNWKGIDDGLPLLLEQLKDYKDAFNNDIRYTWFVRCDKQIKKIYKSEDYLLTKYYKFWKDREKFGDEIGWHIHLYDHDINVLNDENEMKNVMYESYNHMANHKFNLHSSRIGRGYCSNLIMKILFDLKFKIDSSALSGKKRMDDINFIDWENSPQNPYYPSTEDYRVPGKRNYKLLEIPFSMFNIMASYDKEPIRRYINLSYKNSVIKDALKQYIHNNNILVTILHPSELILDKKHPLLSYSIDEVKRNMDVIQSECLKIGKKIKFIRINQIPGLITRDKTIVTCGK